MILTDADLCLRAADTNSFMHRLNKLSQKYVQK